MENLDKVVSDLRAGCDYRLKDGKIEKTGEQKARDFQAEIGEMIGQMDAAQVILKKRSDLLRELQLSR